MEQKIFKKLNRISLYFVVYTSLFITFYMILPYILPFILGTALALAAQGPINLISKKLKVKRGIVGLTVIILIFIILIAAVSIAVAKIINELISLSSLLPGLTIRFKDHGYRLLDRVASYYKMIDPTVIESIKGSANKMLSGSFTAAVFIINILLNILKSLPGLLMVVLFTLLTSVYMAIDLPKFKDMILSMFSREDTSKARNIIIQVNRMMSSYIKAYLILISITFIQTFIGTSILNLRYALLISIITSISDLLPILGPGTVLIPTALVYILGSNYITGIGILVIYIVILVVRQVLEPKVLSASLGIHPLAIIAAIFIGIKAYGFIGMIFSVFFVIFYVVFHKVGLL